MSTTNVDPAGRHAPPEPPRLAEAHNDRHLRITGSLLRSIPDVRPRDRRASRRADGAYLERKAQELDAIALNFARAGRYEQAEAVRAGALYLRTHSGSATGVALRSAARVLRVRYHADARRLVAAATWIDRHQGVLIDLHDVHIAAAHRLGCGFAVARELARRHAVGEDVWRQTQRERALADSYRYAPEDAFEYGAGSALSEDSVAEDRAADTAFGVLESVRAGIDLPEIVVRFGMTEQSVRRLMAEQVRLWATLRVDFLDDPEILADLQSDLALIHTAFGWRPMFSTLAPLSPAALSRWRAQRTLPGSYLREFAKFPLSAYSASFAARLEAAR